MVTKLAFMFGPLTFLLLLGHLQPADAQFENIDISSLLKDMSWSDKAKFLADFLFNHQETFQTLENTLVAAIPILGFDHPPGWFMQAVLPWAMNHLPDLLKNDEFLGIVRTFINELNNHNLTRVLEQIKTLNASGSERLDYLVMKLFSVLDYGGMLSDALKIKSVRSDMTLGPLLESAKDALPILGFDHPPGWFKKYILPWTITHLPDLLKNDVFLGIVGTFITELDNHNLTREFILPKPNASQSEKLDYLVMKLFSVLDYGGMISDVLTLKSVRDFFPYSSTGKPLGERCYNDTMTFFDRLLAGETWALDMFDAIGKPTTGIRRGVLYFLGTYDQCMAVGAHVPANTSLGQYKASADDMFNGKYCRATFKPPEFLVKSIAGEHINQTYGIPLTLSWGMCLPDSCHGNDIEGLLNLGILGSLFNISVEKTVCTEDEDFEEDTRAHIVIGILGALMLAVFISSMIELLCMTRTTDITGSKYKTSDLYDMHQMFDNHVYEAETDFSVKDKHNHIDANGDVTTIPNGDVANGGHSISNKAKDTESVDENSKDQDRKLNMTIDSDVTGHLEITEVEGIITKLLRSFSIFTNLPALVSTDTKLDDVPCLYGIRFTSMLWIMLGNTYIYATLSVSDVPVSVNLMDSFDIMKRFTFQAVMSASLATDTFFMISGCLVTYWFLSRATNSSKTLNVFLWLKFYVGKYFKMTPPYMLVMATFVYLYNYLGAGPMWPERLPVAENCKTDWWKHLLYINNLGGNMGIEAENQCMTWSWQLAVTMQFYLITPILLSFTVFSSSMGFLLIGILAVAGIVSAGIKEAHYGGDLLTSRSDGGDYWNNVFITPWCRVAAYCVGMCLGFALRKWKKQLPKIAVALFWFLAICLGILIAYCQYSKFVDGGEPWTTAQQAAYEALSRPVWALCVAWFVYACNNNLAGPLGEFFSWSGFVPLSRLTFMVYLIHPILMVLVLYTRRSLVYLDDFDMAYLFVGHVTINYAVAIFASLVFDLPFRNLKRIAQGKQLGTPL